MSANALSFRAVRPSCSSGQILLPRYLLNGLRSLDETYRECSPAPADDLSGGQWSRSHVGPSIWWLRVPPWEFHVDFLALEKIAPWLTLAVLRQWFNGNQLSHCNTMWRIDRHFICHTSIVTSGNLHTNYCGVSEHFIPHWNDPVIFHGDVHKVRSSAVVVT